MSTKNPASQIPGVLLLKNAAEWQIFDAIKNGYR
jgi:hypothetical protein